MTSVDLLSFSMRSTPPADGADWFRIVSKKGEPTKVYIYDEIGFWGTTAKDFAATLDEIETSEIHLHLNSPGGSVFDGLAIYNTLKNHKAKVTGIVDGMAASAASFILQAADVRQISRNAQIMIHDAKAYAGGNAEQMRKAADLLDRVSNEIADIYSQRSDAHDQTEFRDLMKAGDEWYNGNEALEAGLVDEVSDNPEEDDAPEEAKNSWSADEVEAFLKTPPEKLAATAQVSVTNRVEEAPMTGKDPQSTTTPPAPVQPPAQPAATTQTLVVNGVEVTDPVAIQEHITNLENFQNKTIKDGRENFVKSLAAGPAPKIGANQIEGLTNFAHSLTEEQFTNWKASYDAAPAAPIFGNYGVEPGDKQKPDNTVADDLKDQIKVAEEIINSNRASGMSQAQIESKPSWAKLQNLKQQLTALSS